MEPLLVRAARRDSVERTPVWFMRQAGRSLPEYRALREKHGFFEINRSAELTAEVTLQPVRRHGVDAAVIFADIMTPVLAMGLDVDLVEGVGPVVAEPVRTAADVARLQVPDPREAVAPVLDAIAIVRAELAREFARVKELMYAQPEVWGALMEKLAATSAAYLAAQAAAGADVVQLFDSW